MSNRSTMKGLRLVLRKTWGWRHGLGNTSKLACKAQPFCCQKDWFIEGKMPWENICRNIRIVFLSVHASSQASRFPALQSRRSLSSIHYKNVVAQRRSWKTQEPFRLSQITKKEWQFPKYSQVRNWKMLHKWRQNLRYQKLTGVSQR